MLIGNNIALVVYGFLWGFTDASDRVVRISFSDLLNLLIQTVLSTLIVLITAEFQSIFFKFMPMV
jgi:hypothetical protein